jgi:tetratricopeptide (TPR) repeat protein
MIKNPWFTLILGLLVGVVIGYILGERAQVAAPASQNQGQQATEILPEGHPPVAEGANVSREELFAQQIAELEARNAANPTDPLPMVMLGNLRFDAGHWQAARMWYERALELEKKPDVIIDLAVVYRNLGQYDRGLELLEQAIGINPAHPVAWFNKVVIYHYDLHDHGAAVEALQRLKELPPDPRHPIDFSRLEAEVMAAESSE